MRGQRIITGATALSVAVATVALGATGVGASTPRTVPHFVGWAAGSTASGANGATSSGPTAQSGVDTFAPGPSSSNTAGHAGSTTTLDSNAVKTSTSTAKVAGGFSITSTARTADVSLVGGRITATAVTTTATGQLVNGKPVTSIGTSFANLKIDGVAVAGSIAKNKKVSIPGIATVTLNYVASTPGDGAISTSAAGAIISLLNTKTTAGAASVVYLNPVSASVTMVGPGYRNLGGYAYDTRGSQHASSAQTSTGPSGATYMPRLGTGGKDVTNNTSGSSLPKGTTAAAAGSSANGLVSDARSYATETVEMTKLNVFNGLITADHLKGVANVAVTGSAKPTTKQTTLLDHLVIAGHAIAYNTPANTVRQLPAGLGTVTINAQSHTATTSFVRVLLIHLNKAAYGQSAGSDLEIGTASASILS